ncbi:MAG: CHAD domain-containing protein [Alphaproteobacteria bacterium]|nr:CHAD domain-containing protein [Alphaproteobacteria bacterium]
MFNGKVLKLAASSDGLSRAKQVLFELADQRHETHTILSTYFDTAANRLRREGFVLCVHERDRRYVQTLRARRANGAAATAAEWVDDIDESKPDLRAPNSRDHLPRALDEGELQAQFTTLVKRTPFSLEPDASTRIDGSIDEGLITVVGDKGIEPIAELTLDLKRGNPAVLYETALRLLEVASLRLTILSKAERGYSLLGASLDPWAARTSAADLTPDMTVEQALERIGWICLTTLLRHEKSALAGIPEGVHQTRVAIRRLRSVINAIKPLLPGEQRELVGRELRWLAAALAPARNWDVLSTVILAPVKSASPGERDLDDLCRIADRERASAHRAANAALQSVQYTTALLKLSRWFTARSWRDQPVTERSALLMTPIGAVAPRLIARRYRKTMKAADQFADLTLTQRHEFRIAVKKLRYTIECLADLFDADKVEKFVHNLRPLQDDLGYANDVWVADQLMATLESPDDRTSIARAAGIVIGWHDRGLADHGHRLSKRVRRLQRARPFWIEHV